MLEQELIQNDVFVDALTLIVLEKFKCLRILNKIKNVHICYSSIKVLHSFVSSIEYNTYVSGVIEWLKKNKNIIFEANGFEETSEIHEYLLHFTVYRQHIQMCGKRV